ncbi:MAG: hypothetical protein GY856_21260 [bacterium]|nr:hypothetical protein [bacterium]
MVLTVTGWRPMSTTAMASGWSGPFPPGCTSYGSTGVWTGRPGRTTFRWGFWTDGSVMETLGAQASASSESFGPCGTKSRRDACAPGLTAQEISTTLGLGQTAVKRDLAFARAWLQRELT